MVFVLLKSESEMNFEGIIFTKKKTSKKCFGNEGKYVFCKKKIGNFKNPGNLQHSSRCYSRLDGSLFSVVFTDPNLTETMGLYVKTKYGTFFLSFLYISFLGKYRESSLFYTHSSSHSSATARDGHVKIWVYKYD